MSHKKQPKGKLLNVEKFVNQLVQMPNLIV